MGDDFLDHVAIWDRLAEDDPFWAVLSDPAKRGGGWDPEAFFATGRAHMGALELELQVLGHSFAGRQVLDFGCGLGRLTQAIAATASFTVGIDASVGMVVGAQCWNRFSDRCAYLLNRSADLAMLPDRSFGAVVSFIVLQHIPPPASHRYLAELARLVAPGGLLVVQVPAEEVSVDLPAAAFQSVLRLVELPTIVDAGAEVEVLVEVANTSAMRWQPRPAGRLRVGNHWVPLDDGPRVRDDGRVVLDAMGPGETRMIRLPVVVPGLPGRYRLEVDVVVEGQDWFADRGCRPAAVELAVVPRSGGRSAEVALAGGAGDPPTFGMFGIDRAEVVQLLEEAGLRILEVTDDDSSGDGWRSWRYLASRP